VWLRLKLADGLTSIPWVGCATNCFTPSRDRPFQATAHGLTSHETLVCLCMTGNEKRFVVGLIGIGKSGAALRDSLMLKPDGGSRSSAHGLNFHETFVCLFMKGSEKRSG